MEGFTPIIASIPMYFHDQSYTISDEIADQEIEKIKSGSSG